MDARVVGRRRVAPPVADGHGGSRELTLGYRVPGLVLDFAAPPAPRGGADGAGDRVGAASAGARRGCSRSRATSSFAAAAGRPTRSSAEGFLVGCIVAAEHERERGAAFAAAGVEFGTPERDGILKPITVLPAPTAKGLEFDAVVVVEPAAIAGDAPGRAGSRLLYVALTRPIQHLTVVHAAAAARRARR